MVSCLYYYLYVTKIIQSILIFSWRFMFKIEDLAWTGVSDGNSCRPSTFLGKNHERKIVSWLTTKTVTHDKHMIDYVSSMYFHMFTSKPKKTSTMTPFSKATRREMPQQQCCCLTNVHLHWMKESNVHLRWMRGNGEVIWGHMTRME